MNHVNSKLLIGLAAAALFAVAASWWLGYSRHISQGDSYAAYALPGLSGRVNQVKTVSIVGAENKPLVTLDNGANGWTVREKGAYPADTGKLRELLLMLADAKLQQAKTAKTELYAELGVEDINAKDAKGLLISLEGLAEPAKLLIGNTGSNANGTFVRLPEQAQSWLTASQFKIERDPAHWLNTALTDIAAERIAEVMLSKQDGKTLHLIKASRNDLDFQVKDIPDGRELAGPGFANALASTLAGLSLEDVETLPSAPSDQSVNTARYRTFDGIIVEVAAWTNNNKHYAQFKTFLDLTLAGLAIQADIDKAKAEHEAQQQSATDQNAANPEAAKTKAVLPVPTMVAEPENYRQKQLQSLQSEVETLQHRFQGWQFVIPEYKYANMVKSLDDLLKPLESKSPTTGDAKASAVSSKP